MRIQTIILLSIATIAVALDPRMAFLIACLILTMLLLSLGGDNE